MSLTLRQLRCVLSVADEAGHFGRAAAKLHMEGPLLSREIRKLEKQLGFAVLDRDARPVVPTVDGLVFLAEARVVLTFALRARAVARGEARLAAGRFLLGFVATPLGRYTGGVSDVFAAAVGDDVLRLVELPLTDQVSAVANGEVDASLVWGPEDALGTRTEHVVCAPRVLVVPTGHPLGDQGSVRIGDLADEDFVDLPHQWLGEPWSRWWAVDPRPDGSTVRYVEHAQSTPELLEIVSQGSAITIMSELSAGAFARDDLAFVPIADVEPSEISFCSRTEDRSPLLSGLRAAMMTLRDTHRCVLGGGATAPAG